MSFNTDDDDVPELLDTSNAQDTTAENPQTESTVKVPLTIICGFLGAGKSTLLKRILTERHGYRIAVIMNEFGDTADIEAKAINVTSADDPAAEGSEEFLELPNGCLCCSIKDVGIAAMEKLMRKKGAFDYILLETTGLADPGPIASMFWTNEEYATGLADIVLDGVVCVVDAVFGLKQMQEDHHTGQDGVQVGESLRQIGGSDVILLNKVDLSSPAIVDETEDLIRQVNPAAPIFRTTRGQIDLKHIIGIEAFQRPPAIEESPQNDHAHQHSENCGHDHLPEEKPQTHYEIRGISSLQVQTGILDLNHLEKLDEWIRSALWDNRVFIPDSEGSDSAIEVNILRCKGAFTSSEGKHFVLQGVRSIYEISPLEKNTSHHDVDVPDQGKVVLIGTGLDERVKASLESILQ